MGGYVAARLARGGADDHSSHGSFETATFTFDPVNQYTLQIERFSRHPRGETVPTWPIEDARMTPGVIEALFASAKNGGTWQAISEQ